MKCGYNKWGGYCPPELSFNTGRLRNGQCEYWQERFYNSWYKHGQLGKMSKEFCDFGRAYKWLLNSTQLSLFKQHCKDKDWVWETDQSGTHEFDSHMMFTTASDNMKQRNKDNPGLYYKIVQNTDQHTKALKSSTTQARAVVGISPDGTEYEWYGSQVAARELGVHGINTACNGVYGSHTKAKGRLKGWTFYWKDEYILIKGGK